MNESTPADGDPRSNDPVSPGVSTGVSPADAWAHPAQSVTPDRSVAAAGSAAGEGPRSGDTLRLDAAAPAAAASAAAADPSSVDPSAVDPSAVNASAWTGAAPPLPHQRVDAVPPPATSWFTRMPGGRRGSLVAGAALAAAVLLGGGYLAGVAWAQGRADAVPVADGTRAGADGTDGQGGPGLGQNGQQDQGQQGQADPFGDHGQDDGFDPDRMTIGQVIANDGATLVLRGRDGGELRVHTTDATVVRVAGDASVNGATVDSVHDLAQGMLVLVAGQRADDGSYTATQILVAPRPGFGHGGDGGPGGPGSAGGSGGSAGAGGADGTTSGSSGAAAGVTT